MDEEFKLCWKNFQDNIASGFQNLYDRGDLVDVTLACDGKLLHAHKIVLAICSPYFQEIFMTNPCKHPIIILKDVSFNIMCELLEFMYQGVVNVKHAELQSFMKIGQLLQIKGLATNSSSSAASTSSEKSTSQAHNPEESNRNIDVNSANAETPGDEKTTSHDGTNANETTTTSKSNNNNSHRSRSPNTTVTTSLSSSGGLGQQSPNVKSESNSSLHYTAYDVAKAAMKRQADFANSEISQLYSRKQFRRSVAASADQNSDMSDANESGTGMDAMNSDDFCLPTISMVESRYNLNSLKLDSSNSERDYREGASATTPFAGTLRNTFGAPFGFDYNLYKNSSNASSGGGSNSSTGPQAEYPNELHMPNDYSKNFGNHMEIPSSDSNLVMLSSTSLLHGNCVFNRNNTVATQQGMKTYWLCKSYRVSMCRARCITHRGRIISATGVHNHPPHMRPGTNGNNGAASSPATTSSGGYTANNAENNLPPSVPSQSGGVGLSGTSITAAGSNSGLCNTTTHSLSRLAQNSTSSNVFPTHNLHGHTQQSESPPQHAALFSHTHHHTPAGNHHHHGAQSSLSISQNTSSNGVIQNMFHNAANLMQLPNMLPPPTSHHEHQQHQHHQQHQQHQQHSPHLSHHHPAHLEITSLMHTSPANTTHHHVNALSNSPQIKGETVNNGTMHTLARTPPPHVRINEDATLTSEQHIMVHNASLSPGSEMNPPTNNTVGSSADVSLSSQIEADHDSSRHQAQVIDSITISPPTGNDASQHFKMEDM